jgi:hypothetical protein
MPNDATGALRPFPVPFVVGGLSVMSPWRPAAPSWRGAAR